MEIYNLFLGQNQVLSGKPICTPQSKCSFENRKCHGGFVDSQGKVDSAKKCEELCQENPKCYWINYDSEGVCDLLFDCQRLTNAPIARLKEKHVLRKLTRVI